MKDNRTIRSMDVGLLILCFFSSSYKRPKVGSMSCEFCRNIDSSSYEA